MKPPVIDGRLDDPAWQGVPARFPVRIGDLPPMNPSAVKMVWDKEALYLGFECYDTDVRSAFTARDSNIYEEGDCVEAFIFLPGEKDRQVEVELNPNTAFLDMLHADGASLEQRVAWNWTGATWGIHLNGTLNDRTVDEGWTAELRLPWAGLADLGVTPPQAGEVWPILFLLVNRVQYRPGRLGREQSTWPALDRMNVRDKKQFAALQFVDARPEGLPVEGFMRIVAGHSRRGDPLFKDYRGRSVLWEYDTAMPDAVLVWESCPLPNKLGESVTLAFVGQCVASGSPKDAARTRFVLLVNGVPTAQFAPFQRETTVWSGNGATIEFRCRQRRYGPSGLFVVNIAASLVKPGRPVRLEVRKAGDGPRTRFMVKAWTDAALYEHHASK